MAAQKFFAFFFSIFMVVQKFFDQKYILQEFRSSEFFKNSSVS